MLKKIILGALALTAGVVLMDLTRASLDSATTPRMIYNNGPMPDFNENQDYTDKQFISLVRLETADGKFFCSGAVISDDYVLTAAHCLMDNSLVPGINKKVILIKSIVNPDGSQKQVKALAAGLNNRADYGLVKGNFKEFTKVKILVKPNMFRELVGPMVTCGFPWGAEDICYATGEGFSIYYEHFITHGRLYPGMSGGPVLDLATKNVFAINTAVADGGIILSPLIGLFETLGVRVIKQ